MKNRNGFTLIELLVVVAIITVLIAILMPSLSAARRQAKVVACGAHLHALGTGVLMYTNEANGRLPIWGQPRNVPSPIPSGNTAYNYVPTINGNYSIYQSSSTWADGSPDKFIGLGRLFTTQYVKDPRVFWCPAATGNTMDTQWPNAMAMNPADITRPAPVTKDGTIRCSYIYRSGANTQFEFPQIANTLVAGAKFVAADVFTASGSSWINPLNHDAFGFNVLGAQGNVVWYRGMPDNGVWHYMDYVYRQFDQVTGDSNSGSIQRDWGMP